MTTMMMMMTMNDDSENYVGRVVAFVKNMMWRMYLMINESFELYVTGGQYDK